MTQKRKVEKTKTGSSNAEAQAKKTKVEKTKVEPSSSQGVQLEEGSINANYNAQVLGALHVIQKQWPGLTNADPLSEEEGYATP